MQVVQARGLLRTETGIVLLIPGRVPAEGRLRGDYILTGSLLLTGADPLEESKGRNLQVRVDTVRAERPLLQK